MGTYIVISKGFERKTLGIQARLFCPENIKQQKIFLSLSLNSTAFNDVKTFFKPWWKNHDKHSPTTYFKQASE
jgi:hypothetical protein